MKNKISSITWDHREQISITELNAALKAAGFNGMVKEIETGSDQYGIVVSKMNIPERAAQEFFDSENLMDFYK